jgi:hypothetical protein
MLNILSHKRKVNQQYQDSTHPGKNGYHKENKQVLMSMW